MSKVEGNRSKRRKTGGRKAGTPNKVTGAMREAIMSVYADLQADSGKEHGHFLEWAKGAPTEFYKIAAKLLPLQVTGEGGQPLQVVMQQHDAAL